MLETDWRRCASSAVRCLWLPNSREDTLLCSQAVTFSVQVGCDEPELSDSNEKSIPFDLPIFSVIPFNSALKSWKCSLNRMNVYKPLSFKVKVKQWAVTCQVMVPVHICGRLTRGRGWLATRRNRLRSWLQRTSSTRWRHWQSSSLCWGTQLTGHHVHLLLDS